MQCNAYIWKFHKLLLIKFKSEIDLVERTHDHDIYTQVSKYIMKSDTSSQDSQCPLLTNSLMKREKTLILCPVSVMCRSRVHQHPYHAWQHNTIIRQSTRISRSFYFLTHMYPLLLLCFKTVSSQPLQTEGGSWGEHHSRDSVLVLPSSDGSSSLKLDDLPQNNQWNFVEFNSNNDLQQAEYRYYIFKRFS